MNLGKSDKQAAGHIHIVRADMQQDRHGDKAFP